MGIYSKDEQFRRARRLKLETKRDKEAFEKMSAQQKTMHQIKKTQSEYTCFNYGGASGSGWRNDRGPVKAHINQTPEELFELICELEAHKLDRQNFYLMYRGKKLKKGRAMRKQGIQGNRRCGFEMVLLAPAPKLEDIPDICKPFVFHQQQHPLLYNFNDDLDIPGSLAAKQVTLLRNY